MLVNALIFAALVLCVYVWLFIVVDICRNEFPDSNKTSWLLLALFLPVIGIVLYLVLGRKLRGTRGGWGTSANIAGIITVPLVAATIIIYRFLASQDLP